MTTRRKSPPRGFLDQVEAAEKVLSLVKLILCAFAATLLWAARLQWNVADLQRQVTEIATVQGTIQQERSARIKDSDAWRHAEEIADVKRDQIIKQLADAESSRTPRSR